ncbi:MAG: c-type cytochrome [Dehalococcoidia bacterium]
MNNRWYWSMPVLFGALVVGLGLSLQIIFARSPYTHANLAGGYTSGYTRTEQSLVGPPAPYVPPGLSASAASSSSDQVALGRSLFVAWNCASCHGLKGQGASFTSPIVGFDAATLRKRMLSGPGGMPAYAEVPPDQLHALVAYLNSVAASKSSQAK